jgi:LysM repeat protein
MYKRYVFALFVVFASVALVYQPVMAKEDTAQIKLRKTAISKKRLYTYAVKEGDVIASIIKNIPGVQEKDISRNYHLIKELNPDIADIDKLEVGQLIVLPGKPVSAPQKAKVETAPAPAEETKVTSAAPAAPAEETKVAKAVPTAPAEKTGVSTPTAAGKGKIYKIKRGDTLYKIIYRELKPKKINFYRTLRAVKSINPGIKNVNKIYAGTVIKLPGETVFVKTNDEIKTAAPEIAAAPEKSGQPATIIEVKEKKMMPPEARLAVLKQIITLMNGSIISTGNYYLPIPKAGQVTIDCSQIPVVEFDDGTTVFVDLENRAHSNLKKMISDNWTNYYLVRVTNDDDVFGILRKVIGYSKNYTMIKSDKPMTTGSLPPVEVAVDWIILKSHKGQQEPIQALRSIYENNILLPKSVKNYYQKNGVTITEISGESGIVGKPEEVYSLPEIPVFPKTSAKDFSYGLISFLGLSAERDVDIQLFDKVKDGFDLSIKADIVVNKENKKYVIYSQALSQQFINALKHAGFETILVNDNDAPEKAIDNILNGLDIPSTHGNYTFSGLEKNQAPYAVKVTGTRIYQLLYAVDFDIDPELRGLLKEVWSVDIARY